MINREDKLNSNLPITPNKRNHDSAFGSPTPKLVFFLHWVREYQNVNKQLRNFIGIIYSYYQLSICIF